MREREYNRQRERERESEEKERVKKKDSLNRTNGKINGGKINKQI